MVIPQFKFQETKTQKQASNAVDQLLQKPRETLPLRLKKASRRKAVDFFFTAVSRTALEQRNLKILRSLQPLTLQHHESIERVGHSQTNSIAQNWISLLFFDGNRVVFWNCFFWW